MTAEVPTQLAARLAEAVAEVLAAHGLTGLTLERVASEAGMSRMTLHRHQIDRSALLRIALESAVGRYRAALWPALTMSAPARDRLEAALEAMAGEMDEHLGVLAALYPEPDSPLHDAEHGEVLEPFAEPFRRLLLDGRVDGSLQVDDPVEQATVLFNAFSWTYVHLRYSHRWPRDRVLRQLVPLLVPDRSQPQD